MTTLAPHHREAAHLMAGCAAVVSRPGVLV